MCLTDSIPELSWWETFDAGRRPVLLYGTGNGADKILDACADYGIRIDGVFASDGFVRDREFRGMHVMSYAAAVERFGEDIIILPAFGTAMPQVMERIFELDRRHTVIIPEVPLYGGEVFDSSALSHLAPRLNLLWTMLSDDQSRVLLRDAVMFRMTGSPEYLKRCEPVRDTYSDLLGKLGILTAFDGGAFRGDSAANMIESIPGISHIIACEPDHRSYIKLTEFSASIDRCAVEVHKCALGCECCEAEYSASGSRGSGIRGGGRRALREKIQVLTIDAIVSDRQVDFIKLDVEGDEADALKGAQDVIIRDRPALALSVYHRTEDIVELPEAVESLMPGCSMYLRRPPCIPMWDLTLYAIPHSKISQ